MSKKIENLFLSVGAMKAGTTWLYEQLKAHPEIYFTPEKEIHFFKCMTSNSHVQLKKVNRNKKLIQLIRQNKSNNFGGNLDWYINYAAADKISLTWYKSLFKQKENEKFVSDFSNLNAILDEKGWDLVRKSCDNLKVVYTLRHPVERIWSHYKFHTSFSGKGKFLEKPNFDHFKKVVTRPWFKEHTNYTSIVKGLKGFLSEDELLLLTYDKIKTEPNVQLKTVTDFLGLDELKPNEESLQKKYNPSTKLAIPKAWREYLKLEVKEEINFYRKILNQ